MDKTSEKLTVFFEDPFWVGVFQRVQDGKLYACKVVFGRQPRDQEVYEFILRHYGELSFSPAVDWEEKQRADNPKRRQRQVRRQLSAAGAGTKAQQALALQREQNKCERRSRSREEKEAEARRRFELKQQKRREKHRGH